MQFYIKHYLQGILTLCLIAIPFFLYASIIVSQSGYKNPWFVAFFEIYVFIIMNALLMLLCIICVTKLIHWNWCFSDNLSTKSIVSGNILYGIGFLWIADNNFQVKQGNWSGILMGFFALISLTFIVFLTGKLVDR